MAFCRRVVCAAVALLFVFGGIGVPGAHAAYWDDVYQGLEQFSRLHPYAHQAAERENHVIQPRCH
ncbi:hypothetical protein [Paenibacillus sp. NPDC055715]